MVNILSKTIKCIEKKIKLKNYVYSTILALKSVTLENHYPKDYISKNGNTLYDFDRVITRMEACNTSVTYESYDKADMEAGAVITSYSMLDSNSCNNHCLCALCASKKRNRILSKIDPYIKTLIKMNAHFYMITATIPNYHVEQLGEAYDHLRRSWTDFVKMGQIRLNNGRSNGEASKFYGSVMSIEIIPSKEKADYFHVHAHILVSTHSKLDYSVISPEKRKELKEIYGHGYNAIPKHEFITNAKSFIRDRAGNNVQDISGFDIPASKITQEWFDCSGAINFRIDKIKEGMVYSKKRNKWEYKTIEMQIPEIIKYESKPWAFKNSINLFRAWDAVSGKRRITMAGVFTRKKRSLWKKLLVYHGLENYFNEYNIDSENQVSKSKVLPFVWDEKGHDYYISKKSFAKEIYKYPGLVKSSRQLRAKILNWYMSEFHKLKKKIGKIDNKKWIKKKRVLQGYVTQVNKYINTELIRVCMAYDGDSLPVVKCIFEHLGIDKKVYDVKVEPFQDDLFKSVEAEIIKQKSQFIKEHHKINLKIVSGIESEYKEWFNDCPDKRYRFDAVTYQEIEDVEKWGIANNTKF
jgi:hypothetical protein